MDVGSVAILEQLSRTDSSNRRNHLAFTIDPVQSHQDHATQQNVATYVKSRSIHPYERYGPQKYALQSYICTNLPLKLTDMDARENNKYEQPSAALSWGWSANPGSREKIVMGRQIHAQHKNEAMKLFLISRNKQQLLLLFPTVLKH
jgi:hypothetical protein